MRVLDFIVDKQILTKDPKCDFTNIIPGSKGYLRAKFGFSEDWDDCIKVVEFSYGKTEYPPQRIDESNECEIPPGALKNPSFNIGVFGRREGFEISTNKISIDQNGGKP